MSARRIAAVAVALLLPLAGLAVAHAATAPAVQSCSVAGDGPHDLLDITASGFTPGESVAVDMVGATRRFSLSPILAGSQGEVLDPTGYRTPVDVTVGSYRLTLTGAAGAATCPVPLDIVGPSLGGGSSTPGVWADLRTEGVGGGNDAMRTLTLDGAPVDFYFSDGITGLSFAVPDALAAGGHQLRFTQDRYPAVTLEATYTVLAPHLLVIPVPTARVDELGTSTAVSIGVDQLDPHADSTVTLVDGAHHATTLGGFTGSTGSLRVTLPNVAPGVGSISVADRVSGLSATQPIHVYPSSTTTAIASGAELISPASGLQFKVGTDGNLVMYLAPTSTSLPVPRWSSATTGRAGARLAPQPDGSWALVTPSGAVVWSDHAPTTDRPTRLVLQGDGNVVVYSAHGHPLWATGTAGLDPTTLPAGSRLGPNGLLRSPNSFSAVMQTDGDLVVLYTNPKPVVLYRTGTAHHAGASITLQSDGDLVIYGANGQALWANHVNCGPGARLVEQADGNLVEYSQAGKAVWASGSRHR